MAGAEAIAEIASALASQAWVQVTAAADLTFANSSIDASLTASNDAVDAVHTYVVVSIGVNLIASTSATGFALLREHSAINAMTTAQKEAINAACTATLANLASDLIGRNASEALDDPIAIANATNNAAQAVKSAWQNVNNLQSRAASTFAGMGPGGFAMTVAGFTTGVGDFFDVVWGFGVGGAQGVLNTMNGLTDIAIGTLNFGMTMACPLGAILGLIPQIPTADWSNGLLTVEDPTSHEWSKWLGGNGVVLLVSAYQNLAEASVRTADIGRKLEYLFGKATGRSHNLERSADMLRQMERVGLPDTVANRQLMAEHFQDVLNDVYNVAGSGRNGSVIRESLLMGPNGALKIRSWWEGNKLLTFILEGMGNRFTL